MKRSSGLAFAVFAILGGVLLLDLALPLLNLLRQIHPADVAAALHDSGTLDAIRVSLETSLASTLIMTVLGVPLAYLLARASRTRRLLILGIVMLPLVLPPLVGGILLLLLFGPYGSIGQFFSSRGIELSGNFAGIILAQVFVSAPFIVVASYSAFRSVDARLEQAASILGDSPWLVFRRISLPLAWPGIAAGIALGWIRTLGEFGATLVIAYSPHTIPIYMWIQFQTDGLRGAFPLAFFLLIAAAITLAAAYLLESLRDGEFGSSWHGAPVD